MKGCRAPAPHRLKLLELNLEPIVLVELGLQRPFQLTQHSTAMSSHLEARPAHPHHCGSLASTPTLLWKLGQHTHTIVEAWPAHPHHCGSLASTPTPLWKLGQHTHTI